MKSFDLNNLNLSIAQKLVLKELLSKGFIADGLSSTNIAIVEKQGKENYFVERYNSSISYNLGLILNNKFFTKQLLLTNKISISPGKVFLGEERTAALFYARELKFPVVLRLNSTISDVRGAIRIVGWKDFKKEFDRLSKFGEEILVEKYFSGKSYRVLTTNHGFFNITKKELPEVTGNGKMTLKKLIEKENLQRANSENVLVQPIRLQTIDKSGHALNLKQIIGDGKKIIFSNLVSAKQGATFRDITAIAHPSIELLARKVLSCLPRMTYISFELLTNNIKQKIASNNYCISELYVSCGPNINFPLYRRNKQYSAAKIIASLVS